MPYIYNTPQDQQDMLEAIGVSSIEDLFDQIPPEVRLERPLDLAPAHCEMELSQHLSNLASQNLHAANSVCSKFSWSF